jgi:hypothetical protein
MFEMDSANVRDLDVQGQRFQHAAFAAPEGSDKSKRFRLPIGPP